MSSTPPQLFDSCRNVQLQGFTGRGATTTPGACSGSRGGTDAPHADETFELDAAAEAALLESIAEADRGDTVPAEDVLRALRNPE